MLNVFISKNLLNCTILSCVFFFFLLVIKLWLPVVSKNDFIMDYSGLSNTPEVPQVAAVGELTGRRSVIQQCNALTLRD